MSDDWQKQRDEAWISLHPINRERLVKAIKKLGAVHNRRMSDDATMQYCRSLAQHASGKAIWQALEESCDDERMPSIHALKRKLAGRPELEPFKAAPLLTDAERKRSDIASIMSMLWLHYEQGWPLEDFAGTTLAKAFGGEPKAALQAAKEIYSRDQIFGWMTNEAANHPLPGDSKLRQQGKIS